MVHQYCNYLVAPVLFLLLWWFLLRNKNIVLYCIVFKKSYKWWPKCTKCQISSKKENIPIQSHHDIEWDSLYGIYSELILYMCITNSTARVHVHDNMKYNTSVYSFYINLCEYSVP